MNKDITNIEANPLLWDALSGEFVALSDSPNRHSLGRLAMETYTHGEFVPGGRGDLYQHTPSWANVVSVLESSTDRGPFHMTGISVKTPSGKRLDIVQRSISTDTGFRPYLKIIADSVVKFSNELDLQSSADSREIVTSHAQELFVNI